MTRCITVSELITSLASDLADVIREVQKHSKKEQSDKECRRFEAWDEALDAVTKFDSLTPHRWAIHEAYKRCSNEFLDRRKWSDDYEVPRDELRTRLSLVFGNIWCDLELMAFWVNYSVEKTKIEYVYSEQCLQQFLGMDLTQAMERLLPVEKSEECTRLFERDQFIAALRNKKQRLWKQGRRQNDFELLVRLEKDDFQAKETPQFESEELQYIFGRLIQIGCIPTKARLSQTRPKKRGIDRVTPKEKHVTIIGCTLNLIRNEDGYWNEHRPSIRAIARASGCSPDTVSRLFKKHFKESDPIENAVDKKAMESLIKKLLGLMGDR